MGHNEKLSPAIEVEDPFAGWGDKEEIASEFENNPEVDIEEVKRQLIEFFGPTQQFSYMSHHGTVVEMMNLCTGIDHILQGGFEVAREWLGSYAVLETSEDDINDKETVDSKQVEAGTSKNIHDRTSSDQTIKNDEPKNQDIQASTVREQSIQQAVNHAKQIAEESTALASVIIPAIVQRVKVEVIREPVEPEVMMSPVDTTMDQPHVRSGTQNEGAEKSSEITIENIGKVEPEQSVRKSNIDTEKNASIRQVENIQNDTLLSKTPAANNNGADSEVIVEKVRIPVELVSAETTQPTALTDAELLAKVEDNAKVVIIPDANGITVYERDLTPLLVQNETKELTHAESEMMWNDNTLEANAEVIDMIEADTDLINVDITSVNSLQQLDTQQHTTKQQPVDELEVLRHGTSIDVTLKKPVVEMYEKLYIKQDAIIDEIGNMVGEQPTEQLAPDATRIAMEQAQKIEQSIVLLNHAKTGRECADRIREIREELAGLLHVLGYKNVDMLVERLFKIYDVKTLRQFMVNLIIANSQAQQAVPSLVLDPLSYSKLGRQVVALLVHPRRPAWV
ncbi:hypothetical protein EON76_00825 [bacterium]|nr:MAG: hypothetical protein EON76_00825 [bacterium]